MPYHSGRRLSRPPVPIRGHTLLCLQGFRGEGYDAMFTAHMAAIYNRLIHSPETEVQVLTRPDTFCHSCPHLSSEEGCTLHGQGTEPKMIAQDREVMNRLGIAGEQVLRWEEIVEKIREKIRASMLDDLCGACPWLPLGYCKEALSALSREGASPSSLPPEKE